MKIKELLEKRNALIAEMENLVNSANAETRAFTNEELADYESKKNEVTALDKTIKAMQETRDYEKKEDTEPQDNENEDVEVRAFENYIRGIVDTETRAENLNFVDNGAVIPSSIANKIIDKVVEISPLYQLATKYNVSGTLTIPFYDSTTGDITMAYAEEFTELTSSTGTFKSISLKGFLAGVLTLVSKTLINNSNFDILGFIVDKMAQNIAIWIEKELLNGTNGKIEGLSKIEPKVVANSATAITADELIDLQESVPDIYQNNAIWIMSKKARTSIRKLKDSEGNYLLNKDMSAKWGYTLLNKDVYISDNIAEPVAGKKAVFYGDMSGLAIKISENPSIDILREKYATQHAVGVYAYIEIDSKVENADKIAALQMKANG